MNNNIKNLQKLLHIVRSYKPDTLRVWLRGRVLDEIRSIRKQVSQQKDRH
jgi:hypothetical protein